jgi:hypothetical protein
MELGIIIGISIAVSLSVSIFVKIAIGVKWNIDINELISRREREKCIEYRVLKDWYIGSKYNFESNEKGKLLLKKN